MADHDLAGFERNTFTHAGKTRTIFRQGTGPAVIVKTIDPGTRFAAGASGNSSEDGGRSAIVT